MPGNFIRGKRGKTEFELCVIDSFDHFFDQAKEAVRQMNSLFPENGITDRLEAAELAPEGSGENQAISVTATWTSIMYLWEMVTQRLLNITACTWESGRRPVPAYEKSNGKHSWDCDLGISMLDSYERVRPMDKKERKCLYYMFLFPEKYWKQLNFYYNTNKAWIPAKSTDKLKSLKNQEGARGRF